MGLFMFAWIVRTFWPKKGFYGQNRGRDGAILTPNELVTRSSADAKRTAQLLQKYQRGTPDIWELP